MKYYIIAGEASGDLYGGDLIRELKAKDATADFRVWGGDLMEAAGGQLVKHYRDLAFMGVWEVIKNLPTILRNIRFCKSDIAAYQPDTLVLIDYPGFNLRIAKWAHQQGFQVFYYISPTVWAWKANRVYTVKKYVTRMFAILPFEADFYKKYDVEVEYYGHPLVDKIQAHQVQSNFKTAHQLSDQPIVALLPGSRKQEITKIFSAMLKVVPQFAEHQFLVGVAPALPLTLYQEAIQQLPIVDQQRVKLIPNQTYDLLAHADAALVTSGTATLETALFNVPQVVCYRTSGLTYQLAKRVVQLDYIAIVNIIAGQRIVEELIQHDLTTANLVQALQKILASSHRSELQKAYTQLQAMLGEGGVAKKIAERLVVLLDDAV